MAFTVSHDELIMSSSGRQYPTHKMTYRLLLIYCKLSTKTALKMNKKSYCPKMWMLCMKGINILQGKIVKLFINTSNEIWGFLKYFKSNKMPSKHFLLLLFFVVEKIMLPLSQKWFKYKCKYVSHILKMFLKQIFFSLSSLNNALQQNSKKRKESLKMILTVNGVFLYRASSSPEDPQTLHSFTHWRTHQHTGDGKLHGSHSCLGAPNRSCRLQSLSTGCFICLLCFFLH